MLFHRFNDPLRGDFGLTGPNTSAVSACRTRKGIHRSIRPPLSPPEKPPGVHFNVVQTHLTFGALMLAHVLRKPYPAQSDAGSNYSTELKIMQRSPYCRRLGKSEAPRMVSWKEKKPPITHDSTDAKLPTYYSKNLYIEVLQSNSGCACDQAKSSRVALSLRVC